MPASTPRRVRAAWSRWSGRCDSGGPLLGFGDVGLHQQRGLMAGPRRRAGRGSRRQQRQRRQPQQFQARAPQHRQRQGGGHHHEDERKPVDAGDRAPGAWGCPCRFRRCPAPARRSPAARASLRPPPTGGHRGHRPPAAHQDARPAARTRPCAAPWPGRTAGTRPSRAAVAHAAVDRQHELDPVADAEPVDHAGDPAQQKAAPRPRLARHRDQQRRERHRRQPRPD